MDHILFELSWLSANYPFPLSVFIPDPLTSAGNTLQDSTSHTAAASLSVESWKGRVEDIQSLYVFLEGCCYILDLPVSKVSLRQTSNHMPRLDCPSVSAETLKTLNPKPLNN